MCAWGPLVDGTLPKPPPVDASLLPSAQSPDLILVPANAVEYAQTSRLNADEWRGPLNLQQYLGREMHLLKQDLTKNKRSTGWILTSEKLPVNKDGTRPILASCESILKDAYIAKDGKLNKILSHGIGSVFTRPEHRGKGYAGRMMIELGKKLENWQQHNGDTGSFSVLYSDIGPKFYHKLGWPVFPSTHIHLASMSAQEYNNTVKGLDVVKDLHAADLKNLRTVEYAEEALKTASSEQPETTFVAFRPDLEHFGWHHAREGYVAEALGRSVPEIKGAIHEATGVAVVWCRVFATKQEEWQLHILHVMVPPTVAGSSEGQKALSALLLRAQREADIWGMLGGVEVWDPTEMTISAAQALRREEHGKVEIITRDAEHLCSLRWVDPSLRENTVWKFNEKFAWC